MKDKIALALKGFCMGAADVVPGVSGGTMAFILGIYERLLNAIASFDAEMFRRLMKFEFGTAFVRPHWHFLIPLAIGIMSAILFFTRVVPLPTLIRTHPEHVYGLFFGLICGSIVVLFGTLKPNRVTSWVSFCAGLLVGYAIVTAIPAETPQTWWFTLCSGMLAITAMILPGISGSFILLILGQYAYVFDAIGNFRFSVIIPFAIGAAIGLMLFSRVLSYLLKHYRDATTMLICGFLVASLWVVWPFQDRQFEIVRGKEKLLSSTPYIPDLSLEAFESAGLALIGFVFVVVISYFSLRKGAAAD